MDNNFNDFDPFGNQEQSKESFNKQNFYNTTSNNYNSSYLNKKKSKKVSFKVLVACCLICAILGGAVSTTSIIYFGKNLGLSSNLSANQNNNTVINVEKSSTNAISAIAKKVIPSVVGIRLTATVNSFFGFSSQASSDGSGVVYSKDGYIITNYHVVAEATNNKTDSALAVYLPSEPETPIAAKVIGFNSDYDLAVIKIEKSNLTPVELETETELEVGELAVAIGSPGGLDYMSSVSSGIISGLNRTIQLEGTAQMRVIQTDAAINPGNSGGALVNFQGKLVGINSSKISDESFEGMGFAIPAKTVEKIAKDIIDNKDKKYAYLGITISTQYTAQMLESMGYPAGAVVESVADGSPAAKVGINSSDIITEFEGVKINSSEAYNEQRLKHSPGETISLSVYRGGQTYKVDITLGESDN